MEYLLLSQENPATASNRDQILHQHLFDLIQTHTQALNKEIIELRNNLEQKQNEEKQLRRRVREWEKQIREWFDRKSSRFQTPPPKFYSIDDDRRGNAQEMDGTKTKTTDKNDRIRSIVESANRTIQNKRRKQLTNDKKRFEHNQRLRRTSESNTRTSRNAVKKNYRQEGTEVKRENFMDLREQSVKSQFDTANTEEFIVNLTTVRQGKCTFPERNNSRPILCQEIVEKSKNQAQNSKPKNIVTKDTNKNEKGDNTSVPEKAPKTKPHKSYTHKVSHTRTKPYKYKEVVRNRSDRRSMRAHDCPECKAFLDAVCGKEGENNIFDRSKLIQQCSRHRSNFSQDPPTPDGFWELSFADSLKAREMEVDS